MIQLPICAVRWTGSATVDGELAPLIAAMVDDVSKGCDGLAGEPIVAVELSEIFNGVKLWAFCRQGDDADFILRLEFGRSVPARLIYQHNCGGFLRKGEEYLF